MSTYCFIRNKRLLSSELVVPKPKIARLIQTFHEFTEAIKATQLSILDDYFKSDRHRDLANATPEVKLWWQELQELSAEENRKAAIWFSRYCFDPEITLATIESVFIAEREIAASQQKDKEAARSESQSRSPTEYSHVPAQQSDRPNSLENRNTTSRSPNSGSHKPFKINLIVPLIWLIVTLVIAVFDLNQPVDALSSTACENLTQENGDYCSLVTQIVGVEYLDTVVASLPEPLTPEESLVPEAMMNYATENCELHGNIAAGVPLKEAAPFKTPVLSSSAVEMLPDFYVADVQQTNLKEGDLKVRTVCFFNRVKKIGKPYSIDFVAYDRVDLDWPEVAYEPSKRVKSLHTLGKTTRTYNFLSLFGVNTLFTAIAIYLLAVCGMAIKVDSIDTIYQASFILGMTKSILSFLPVFGIFILIPIECIALGITSGCVKGFKIDWNAGYHFVAATAMLLLVSRALFTYLFLGFLTSLFG